MINKLLPRRTGGFAIAAVLVTGMSAGFASGAFAAVPPSIEGTPCTYNQIDNDVVTVESSSVSPVVTHFSSFNLTAGTTLENTYHLSLVNRVSTSIHDTSSITHSNSDDDDFGAFGDGGDFRGNDDFGGPGDSQKLFDQVKNTVGFGVQSDQGATSTQDTTIKWRFNQSGYFGLYKGTRQVSGTFSRFVCSADWNSPRYERHGGGTYSTFGAVEEGTVRCSDILPAGSVRRAAQSMLQCGRSAHPEAATVPAEAGTR